jgi:hypothetical protein
MKKKVTVVIAALFLIFNIKAQSVKVSSSYGLALGETKFTKKNALYSDIQVGYEITLEKGYYLSFSIGQSSIGFDYYDQNFNSVYNDRTFITIPVLVYKDFHNTHSGKINLYGGIGASGSWCFRDRKKIKNFQTSTTILIKNTGFNISVLFEGGAHILLSPKTSLNISLQPQIDVFTSYTNELNEIKLIKNLLSFSYRLSINKK